MKRLKDKIAGTLYGVVTGDALGAPLEFMNKEEISRKHGRVTEMIGGGWLNVVPGEVTDDTQMTLAVAEGIREEPDNPIQAIGKRFIAWAKSGPKDIGGTCSMSIRWAAFLGKMTRQTRRNGSRPGMIPAKQMGGRSAWKRSAYAHGLPRPLLHRHHGGHRDGRSHSTNDTLG